MTETAPRDRRRGAQGVRRILHVVHGYFPESSGGTEAHVRDLCARQGSMGLEPSILHGSFEPRGQPCLEPRTDLEVPAFRLHRADTYSDFWDRAHDPAVSALFRGFLRRERPDLVHVHQWIRLGDDLCQVCAEEGVPSVLFLHDVSTSCPACFRLRPDDEHCERVLSAESCLDCVPLRGHEGRAEVERGVELYAANFRNELRKAGAVLAATEATASLVTRGLGLPRELVTLLPLPYGGRFGGIALPGWQDRGPDEPLRLAFWGLVTARKGVDVLLRALRLLAAERAIDGTVELLVLGKVDRPELERELRELAEGLPVRFGGRYEYEDVAGYRPHAAVFPSTCFETYGLVLDEAMALGCPALVTGLGAFAERVGDAGLVVPPKDPAALAAALARLLDEPDLLPGLAAAVGPLSPTPDEHAALLARHYAEAAARVRDPAGGPTTEDRLALEVLRRTSATAGPPLRRGLAAD